MTKGLAAGDPRHGTENGYNNRGCRCDECRAAHVVAQRAQRQRRAQNPLPTDDPRHGKVTTYGNHGCRCPACTEAHRLWQVDRYRRAKFQRYIDECARAGVYIYRGTDGALHVTLDESLRPAGDP